MPGQRIVDWDIRYYKGDADGNTIQEINSGAELTQDDYIVVVASVTVEDGSALNYAKDVQWRFSASGYDNAGHSENVRVRVLDENGNVVDDAAGDAYATYSFGLDYTGDGSRHTKTFKAIIGPLSGGVYIWTAASASTYIYKRDVIMPTGEEGGEA